MTEPQPPILPRGDRRQVAEGVHVIPDHDIPLVPNVGIVEGRDAVLVVDTAMGIANAERVVAELREVTEQPRVLVTITHFHPEHGFGAQVLRREGTLLYNRAQGQELARKGQAFVDLFRTFGPHVAEQLEGVELVPADILYDEEADLQLGNMVVEMRQKAAHTAGDQIVWLPEQRVLFTGDLVENGFLPIVPDADVRPGRWIEVLAELEELEPDVVVPGHGEPAGPQMIAQARDYLIDVRDAVADLRAAGADGDAVVAELEPKLRARYADRGNHEWIAPAIRAFVDEPSAG
jgi:glyoxylase-like metal-dependent hydrolase (beta-lactamase superfamily II)